MFCLTNENLKFAHMGTIHWFLLSSYTNLKFTISCDHFICQNNLLEEKLPLATFYSSLVS